jgi:DedD protein
VQANIKQRVLGFVVIVAIAIVFLPMVLDGDNGRNIAYQTTPKIPARDIKVSELSMPTSTKVMPRPDSSANSKGNNQPSVSANDQESDSKQDKLVDNNSSKSNSLTVTNPKNNSQQPTKATNENQSDVTQKELLKTTTRETDDTLDKNAFNTYVIQVGSFSNRQNAKRLQEKLRQEKFKVFMRTQKSLGKLVNVVYVGQFKTKQNANAQVSKVEKVAGLKVIILPFEAVTNSLQ